MTAVGLAAGLSFIAAAFTWVHSEPSVTQGPVAAPASASASPWEVASPKREPAKPIAMETPAASDLPGTGPPQRVQIDSLGIDASVLSIVADGRSLTPPGDPQMLGWWSGGAKPGARTGSALVTGHTVHDGGGALDNLERITPGAVISVQTASGLIRYVADTVDVLDKDTIANRAPDLFSQQVDGRLVLVTCEDWDGTGYLSNVVVTATPMT